MLLGTFLDVFGPSEALLGDFWANKCEHVRFLILMPLSNGINVFEVWGCQVGARWVQREPPGAIWGHFGVIWASLWAFLVHFWPLFFRVRFQGRFLG